MKKGVHFLGIGGIGMSALAHILLERGESVSGVDQKESAITSALKSKGAAVHIGDLIPIDPSLPVIYSSAIRKNHPTLLAAKHSLHRSELLNKLMHGQKPLLVTGTHGKTSTTGLLAWTFLNSGLRPSYAVGGIIISNGKNGGSGDGEYFVAEADESDGSFLNYSGHGAIITNLEREHFDYWKTEKNVRDGFQSFAKQVENPDLLFWCSDDQALKSLNLPGKSYGFGEDAEWRLAHVRQENECLFFNLSHRKHFYEEIKLPLIGAHQALNAAAVWALASEIGIPEEKLRKAFETFKGMKRRLEKKGEARGAVLYDDYAHHPTEIRATLSAMRLAMKDKRLIAIFQPHRYSRTRDMMNGFIAAFDAADQVVITDVYAAGEEPIPSISGRTLSDKIPGSSYVPRTDLKNHLESFMQRGDVMVTIGAGDITQVFEKFV